MFKKLPNDIQNYILSFVIDIPYEFLNFIDINKINFNNLNKNSNAIYYLKHNPNIINLEKISSNPNGHIIINKYIDMKYYDNMINWDMIAINEKALHIIKKRLHYFNFSINICRNPSIIELLKNKSININLYSLCLNTNKYIINIIKKNINKLNQLNKLKQYHWDNLSLNINTIDLLEKNKDKINWDNLSLNINAIDLLEKNKDKINWDNLSLNSNIFIINHNKYNNRINIYKKILNY